jgi:hypothetical protein|tara:strand:- start:151 stop:525 length:375 start_codon:yes stop_codon:yes gene_type:complete
MPTYIYEDPETNQITSVFMSISDMEKRSASDMSIELDGVHLKRRLDLEIAGVSTGSCATWPMKSDAAGVHPDQVGEYAKDSVRRGVPTEFDKSTGQAIFTSRQHRAKYLRAYKMFDKNGGYSDG